MNSIKCTCLNVSRLGTNYTPICPIHVKPIAVKAKDMYLHDAQGYLVVCVCECDCQSCHYTKLVDLIREGIKIKPVYADHNFELKPIAVIE